VSPRRKQKSYAWLMSVLAHAAIVAALTFSLPLATSNRGGTADPEYVEFEAVVVDRAVLEEAEQAEQQRIEEARLEAERIESARAEAERAAEQERIRLQSEEAERVAEQERLRVAAEQRAEAERLDREQEEREAAERERQRREEEARLAAERAAEEERRQREAEERAVRERLAQELAAAVAAENEQRQARDAGYEAQWIREIENKVRRSWVRPQSAGPGLDCLLVVNLDPSGYVTGVSMRTCNGDATVVASIERAVFAASPLPEPPVRAVFQRVINMRFKPEE